MRKLIITAALFFIAATCFATTPEVCTNDQINNYIKILQTNPNIAEYTKKVSIDVQLYSKTQKFDCPTFNNDQAYLDYFVNKYAPDCVITHEQLDTITGVYFKIISEQCNLQDYMNYSSACYTNRNFLISNSAK